MTDDLIFTFPWPSEIRRRTWYGRIKLLPDAIAWVIAGPIMLGLAIAIVGTALIAIGVPLAVYKTRCWLKDTEPEVYRDGG